MNYVIAVSGGVDSVALLDMVAMGEVTLDDAEKIVVAHFDHGIRADSEEDTELVKKLAKHYGYLVELGQGELGKTASEDKARQVRYSFLRQVCKKYDATLVTAHHQDDVLETMIINLLRGTSWRGMASLQSSQIAVRPILQKSKQDLVAYAERHNLTWHEDSTNQDESYLRNYIRLRLIPKLKKKRPDFVKMMLGYNSAIAKLKPDIQKEIEGIVATTKRRDDLYTCSRYKLIMWPGSVSAEYIYSVLTQLDPDWHPERHHIARALNFVKTAKKGSALKVGKSLAIAVDDRMAEFQNT